MKKFLLFMVAAILGLTANAATIYFHNSANWPAIYVWTWDGSDATNTKYSWPGPEIGLLDNATTVEKDGVTYWKYETNCASMILSTKINGSEVKAGGGDLKVVDQMIYDANGATGTSWTGGEIVVETEVFLASNINSWSGSNEAYKFTKVSDTEYTYSLASADAAFQFKVVCDGWLGYPDEKLVSGKSYTLYDSGTNNCALSGAATDIKFSFNPSNKALVVTYKTSGDTPDPVDPTTDYSSWYVNVRFSNNSYMDNGVAASEEGLSKHAGLAIGDGTFNIKTWNATDNDVYLATTGAIPTNEWVQLSVAGVDDHMTIAGATANSVYTVEYNCATKQVKVTPEGVVDPIDPTPTTRSYRLHGQIMGDTNWSSLELTYNEGKWEGVAGFVPGEFGLQVFEDGVMLGEEWIGGGATITEANTAYSFVKGANSSSTLEGNYTFVYDPTANTVTFIPYGGEIEEVISWALRGNIVTGEWDDYALTEENGKLVATLLCIPGNFGIKRMVNGVQGEGDWYAAPTAAEAAIDATGDFQGGNLGTTNWASTLTGSYTFSFDPETMILTVASATTGVEAIEAAEEVEAVYYNLQGVRVANPENGLYIRVAGKTASKVYIR